MLHKFVWEIDELPTHEFDDWMDYLDWKHEQEKKAQKKAGNKQGKNIQTY